MLDKDSSILEVHIFKHKGTTSHLTASALAIYDKQEAKGLMADRFFLILTWCHDDLRKFQDRCD